MKTFFWLFVAILLLTESQSAFAGGWGTKVTTITGFYTWSNGDAHFRVADMENPDNCLYGGYLTIDRNGAHFNALYATLMTAYVSGKTVQLSYVGCTQGGSYPLINAIAVPGIW